jgi:hypothetical protein
MHTVPHVVQLEGKNFIYYIFCYLLSTLYEVQRL